MKKSILLVLATILMVACSSTLAQQARDTSAALNGAIAGAQAKYQSSCTANPSQQVCTVINQAVAGQNALITATEAYCGWVAGTAPTNQTCTPVSNAEAGLTAAIANANQLITQIKGAI